MSVAIGLPSTGSFKAATLMSVLGLVYGTKRPLHVIERQSCYIHESRALIVAEAVRAGCSHLLFLDSDMQVPGDTIERLLAHDKPVIGTTYNERRLPLTTTVKFADATGALVDKPAHEIPHDTIFPCYAVGTGCMLIRLDIIPTLSAPLFFFRDGTDGPATTGEDVWFCERVHAAGHSVWCDPTIPVRHVGDYAY